MSNPSTSSSNINAGSCSFFISPALGRDAAAVVLTLGALVWLAYFESTFPEFLQPFAQISLAIVHSMDNIRWIVVGAFTVHLVEAWYSQLICQRLSLGYGHRLQWFVAVFLLGFPALRHLLSVRDEKRKQA